MKTETLLQQESKIGNLVENVDGENLQITPEQMDMVLKQLQEDLIKARAKTSENLAQTEGDTGF
jgi:hypothetical protein